MPPAVLEAIRLALAASVANQNIEHFWSVFNLEWPDTTGWLSTLGWSCLDCTSCYVQGKTAQSSSPLPLFDRVGCRFCTMALQEPRGFQTQQPPTLVAPPLIAGRDNTWITVCHGNATLPFVVSRPNDDSGKANAVVLLLPGCGHFFVENMHPLPWQGAIEHLWSNLAFKRAIIAYAWPVAGQAGSPPAWMLPDGAAWTNGGAAASQGERRTFCSGLLHWLTTMECPGPVLP